MSAVITDAVEHLVRGIVDSPDDVDVRQKNGRRYDTVQVRVHPEDLGRVIGRAGRTAKALRAVVSALPGGQDVRVDVVDTDRRR
ncbi:RNA-binding protein [Nesterenkonia populi]